MEARTRDEVVAALLEAGVPCGEVMSPFEVLDDEQAVVSDMISRVPSFAGAEVKVAANPIRLDPGPRRLEPIPAPGEQTIEILRDVLGYDESRVQALLDSAVVGAWKVVVAA
jgi:formyl-CoA transferase